MEITFTRVSKSMILIIVIFYVYAFLFENLFVAAAGSAVLFYLAYNLMEYRKKISRIELVFEREPMDRIIHKSSPLTVRIQVSASETLGIRFTERIPSRFRLVQGETGHDGILFPEKPVTINYTIVPLDRGYHKLNPLEVVLTDSRGLFRRNMEYDDGLHLFVQASKQEISMARLMAKRKQFEITGLAHKRHTRTTRTEFKSIREYIPGDRFRDIDWKAASRLTRLMTKEYDLETRLPTIILMDSSLSMRELVGRRSKLDHAISIGLQVATLLKVQGHPVGLIAFDEHRVIREIHPVGTSLDEVLLGLFQLPNPTRTGGYPGMPETVPVGEGKAVGKFMDNIGPFLVKGRRGSYSSERTTGVFEAVRCIKSDEGTGFLLVVISDLETNNTAVTKALALAKMQNNRVIVISPFSWPYHVSTGDIDLLTFEEMYEDLNAKQLYLNGLRSNGIRVIEMSVGERGDRLVSTLRRMSQ
ncbi:MAG: DUF58 domain-containing protein [Thermoplasmatota archaeon]